MYYKALGWIIIFRYKSLHRDPRQEMKENLQSLTLQNNDFGEKKFQCSVD